MSPRNSPGRWIRKCYNIQLWLHVQMQVIFYFIALHLLHFFGLETLIYALRPDLEWLLGKLTGDALCCSALHMLLQDSSACKRNYNPHILLTCCPITIAPVFISAHVCAVAKRCRGQLTSL